jgi:hypothetical protein
MTRGSFVKERKKIIKTGMDALRKTGVVPESEVKQVEKSLTRVSLMSIEEQKQIYGNLPYFETWVKTGVLFEKEDDDGDFGFQDFGNPFPTYIANPKHLPLYPLMTVTMLVYTDHSLYRFVATKTIPLT